MRTDIRWRLGTAGHPKIVRLVTACGERAFRALAQLWEWTAAHRPDGDLRGLDEVDLSVAAGWPDAPPAFVETLRSIRFLDGKPGRLRVHDWTDEQPWVSGGPGRSEAARLAGIASGEARRAKAKRSTEPNGEPNGIERPVRKGSTPSPSPYPLPSPSPSPFPAPPQATPRTSLSGHSRSGPGANPPGLPASPSSGGVLPAKIAADKRGEAVKASEFQQDFRTYTDAGNPDDVAEFRRIRVACVKAGVPFDPSRRYSPAWSPEAEVPARV